ncbi:MAG: TolC family protein [Verrucomicrobia bacterium]|nr:TolC family protein [Verrucomicrobiota bacterium]
MNSALRISWPLPKVASFMFLIVLSGCSTTAHRKKADDAVLKIVAEVEEQLFGKTSNFSIETSYTNRKPDDISVDEIFDDRERNSRTVLFIDDAIKMAVTQNRQYQREKENLYLSALTLTGERHEFTPQFFAGATGSRNRRANGERNETIDSNAGVGQFLTTGANVSVSIANDVLRFLTGDSRKSASSVLSFSVFQPLLRGAGREAAAERLTQAERNVIYAIRDFSHFQNQFEIDIVIDYFRLLQQKDTIFNEYNNYQSRIVATKYLRARSVDREKALDVNQAEQAELSARNRYINAIVRYKNSLDQFKITLGLPQTVDLQLQDEEIELLQANGLIIHNINTRMGFQLSVDHRLPLLNAIDQFEDVQRKVRIAANNLKADLGIFANASVDSEAPRNYNHFDFDEVRTSVGIQLDLPIDRLRERNNYRASLIRFESELRALGLTLDSLRSQIDENLRELERLDQNYQIQTNAVELAVKQVAGAQLSIESGKAIYRDLEEAQDDLIAAQNAQTAALVDYLEARLNLLLELGILNTDTTRFWLKESSKVKLPAGIYSATESSTISADGTVITPDQLFAQ